ncbi:hypothetical protein KAR26_02500 [Candidatus Parcubacteria bacterium]|nr:hypothetical protein [Candidatus Parcubacteria bacterium]
MIKKTEPKILFYTSIPRSFYTTLIGYLYEISQVYPVVLLSENLDPAIAKLLEKKDIFPKLEIIVPIKQYTGKKRNAFSKNYYLYNLAKNIVKEHKPNIVITANDVYPFEMYLMRFAKKINAVNVCFQSALQEKDIKELVLWSNLSNAYLQYPKILPLKLRLFFSRLKKFFGHIFFYWMLPLMVGERPFLGKSSFIIWKNSLSLQIADYQTVFSEMNYNLCVENGSSSEKVLILPHPLESESREIFKEMNLLELSPEVKKENKMIVIMWPAETVSFRRSDYSLISKEELLEERIKIVALINQTLNNWKIIIKPHPVVKNDEKLFQEITHRIASISKKIEIIDPNAPAEKYMEMSDVIVGMPPASTTIFIASLQSPKKPILSLDLNKELMGDYYDNFKGIEYIDNKTKFASILELIRNNKYHKKNKIRPKEKEFSNSVSLLRYLFDKKYEQK